jgi:hypothetical protein
MKKATARQENLTIRHFMIACRENIINNNGLFFKKNKKVLHIDINLTIV